MAKAPTKKAATKAAPKKAEKSPGAKTAKAATKQAGAKPTKPDKTSKKKANMGDRYSCEVCGIVVSVDEACGCVEPYDIVCCGQQMARK